MSGSITVNWTLFPSFDKNIEYTLECIPIGIQIYVISDLCEGKRRRSYAFTSMRISFPFVMAFHLRWIGACEFSSIQVSLDCHERLYLYV